MLLHFCFCTVIAQLMMGDSYIKMFGNDSDIEQAWAKAYNPMIAPYVYVLACIYLAVVGFMGVSINIFVILLFIKAKQVILKGAGILVKMGHFLTHFTDFLLSVICIAFGAF